ncbi:MAG: hypothetical protein SFV81_03100 [Pirellulaceae bacterium]|nr:hypothetical protein [Pirellulaceae bacterium]
MKNHFLLTLSFLAMLATTLVLPVHANETGKKEKNTEPIEAVEMFEAIKDGKIEVQLIPKDATQASVVIRNKGDKPLNIKLPATFGAVSVLGQMGMGGMGMGGMGGMGGGMGGMGGMGGGMGGMGGGMGGMGGGQGMGGGMGGMGGGMGGMGGGMGGMGGGMGGMGGGGMGGMFRVNPDRPGKLKVPCVCLEHGKQDPNPRMKYKIVPLEEVNADPRVRDLCTVLGQGKVPQNTAQAAAWHIANHMSWDELAHKNRIESQYIGNIKFFDRTELQSAFQLTSLINQAEQMRRVSENASPGYSTSTSTESNSSAAKSE